MKIGAVISEFNPFHNGHKYLIDKLKADGYTVVAVMSGSFTQRGDVSIIDKYARAESAVLCGVDLVLELPAPWCFSGAEFFALGGVSVADGLGVVYALAFGSESGDIASLTECAARLSSDEYASVLASARETRPDANTARLRADVYSEMYGDSAHFNGSNDLLALEYLSAIRRLGSGITPITVKREGEAYNSDTLTGICSATAIRRAVSAGDIAELERYMPKPSADILRDELDAGRRYRMSKLDRAVIARLRTGRDGEFSDIMELSGGMENKLIRHANECFSIDELVERSADKRYSQSRVRRGLLSMMLGVTMSDAEKAPLFTMILAANSVGREVLSLARKCATINIISKPSQAKYLNGDAAYQYALHMRAERLAELCCDGTARRIGALML